MSSWKLYRSCKTLPCTCWLTEIYSNALLTFIKYLPPPMLPSGNSNLLPRLKKKKSIIEKHYTLNGNWSHRRKLPLPELKTNTNKRIQQIAKPRAVLRPHFLLKNDKLQTSGTEISAQGIRSYSTLTPLIINYQNTKPNQPLQSWLTESTDIRVQVGRHPGYICDHLFGLLSVVTYFLDIHHLVEKKAQQSRSNEQCTL